MRLRWSVYRDYIGTYLRDVGILAFALFGTISGLVTLVVEPIMRVGLEPSQWLRLLVALLIASISLAQGVVHYRVARLIVPGERIEHALQTIAQLREECVRDFGNADYVKVDANGEVDEFTARFTDWHNRLAAEVERVSPSQATIFKVLGTVTYPVAAMPGRQAEVVKLIYIAREYAARVKEMVDRFSLENMSNRVSR